MIPSTVIVKYFFFLVVLYVYWLSWVNAVFARCLYINCNASFVFNRKSAMKRMASLIGRTAVSCWHHGRPHFPPPPTWAPGPPYTCLQIRHLAAKQVSLKMPNPSLMLIRRVTSVQSWWQNEFKIPESSTKQIVWMPCVRVLSRMCFVCPAVE